VEGAAFSSIEAELTKWSSQYVDVTELGSQLENLHSANKNLTQELGKLRDANMVSANYHSI